MAVADSPAAHEVNQVLTIRNWLIGYYIVEFEQNGQDRAENWDKLIKELAKNLQTKGLSETNLKLNRQFYFTYLHIGHTIANSFQKLISPIGQTLPDQLVQLNLPEVAMKVSGEKIIEKLSFSHISELIKIDSPLKRAFYEIECIKGTCSLTCSFTTIFSNATC